MISPRLTLVGVCLAALTLAACGDDEPEDTVSNDPAVVVDPAPVVVDPAPVVIDPAPPAMNAAPPAMDAAPPAMNAAPPAMDAAPPAMNAAPPAMDAAPPAAEGAGAAVLPDPAAAPADVAAVESPLSIFDVTGTWAVDAAACMTPEVVEIRATMLVTPEQECDIVTTESVSGEVEVTLSCPAGAAANATAETWRIGAVGDDRPATSITMARGPEFADPGTLVRCN